MEEGTQAGQLGFQGGNPQGRREYLSLWNFPARSQWKELDLVVVGKSLWWSLGRKEILQQKWWTHCEMTGFLFLQIEMVEVTI